MMNFTLEYWLDLAPCPPPSKPGLLYSNPYPTNLTTEELGRIAGRCKVPSREQLASRLSGEGPPEVFLVPLLLSLGAAALVVSIIVMVLYSYKHNKHRTRDTCLQTMPKSGLLGNTQATDNTGCDNQSYQSSAVKQQIERP